MVIKLQIFMIKKFQRWTQLYLFSSNQLGFWKDENYYLQAFLKECKCINKKVIVHINDSLSD